MSPCRTTLSLCALLLAASIASPAASAGERRDEVREQVALSLVRLLPPQPEPARRFAPVPARRGPQAAAVWIDRELAWVGSPDRITEAVRFFPGDELDPVPVLPPFTPPFDDDREICVGTVVRADFDDGDGLEVVEMDCAMVPVR